MSSEAVSAEIAGRVPKEHDTHDCLDLQKLNGVIRAYRVNLLSDTDFKSHNGYDHCMRKRKAIVVNNKLSLLSKNQNSNCGG